MQKEKTNKLSVYLIKEGVRIDDVLKSDSYEEKVLEKGNIFYYGQSASSEPSWVNNFFESTLGDITLYNQSSKGLYFVKTTIESKEKIFALPFGYGHSMLNKELCVDDFGLKTVLNLVERDSIRKIGKRTLSSEPKNTIEQLSKIGNISDFGIDIEQDLIEEITGKPKDDYFGKSLVTGKIAFTASVKVNISNVDEFVQKCFDYYIKDDYKKNFAFIDQVKEIKNTGIFEDKLIEKLKDGSDNNVDVWMAIPEIIDWADIAGFSFTGKKENLLGDITIDEFTNSLSDEQKANLDMKFLKSKKVTCFKNSTDDEYANWSCFKCFYCEITENGKKIILTNGKWYEIARDFVGAVENNYQNTIKESNKITFIECGKKQYEDKYNEFLAKSIDGILMDRKNIVYGGGASSVEFCDVYDKKEKAFIHVKNYYGSSALSHLFAQGKVSGQLFLSDSEFRKKVKEKEPKLSSILEDKPKPEDYKIIFAIISESSGDLHIPFFSKVNFKSERNLLNTFGFKNVHLVKIKRNDK